jgi:hypothetical protein
MAIILLGGGFITITIVINKFCVSEERGVNVENKNDNENTILIYFQKSHLSIIKIS